ncbi:MAG: Hsp20/alpha crystallin family protein [Pseudomonadales bacterium]
MSIVQWNPWKELDDVFGRVVNAPSEHLGGAEWSPAVDITETDEAYRIDLEIPGVPGDQVNVSVKDGVLTVEGERRFEAEANGRRQRIERRYGRFARRFRLPEDVEDDAISARARDGVLELTVGKKAKAQPRSIQVQVH